MRQRLHPRFGSPSAQAGLTLVELMVAITVSLILLAGVLQLYLSSRQTYRIQDDLSRLQENARFSMEFLSKDVRDAGYQGCLNLDEITKMANPPRIKVDPATAVSFAPDAVIAGHDYSGSAWSPVVPATVQNGILGVGAALPGTDAVTVRKAGGCGVFLNSPLSGNTVAGAITVATTGAGNACGIATNDTLVISDCQTVDIFRASDVSTAAGVTTIQHAVNAGMNTADLSRVYDSSAQVMTFEDATYYLANGTQSNTPSLWRFYSNRAAGANNPQELVEDVQDMQIEYGELSGACTSGSSRQIQYKSAGTVADWANVVSVRINLLVRTAHDNLATEKKSYTFNGGAGTFPNTDDYRLRRVFTSTITLRNRTCNL